MWEEFKCCSCPGASFWDRDVYAQHVKSKWHMHNSDCTMMGRPTLNLEDYEDQFGDGAAKKKLEEEAQKKREAEERAKAEEAMPTEDLATVVIIFNYQEEKWSHRFSVTKGSTILDLKQAMIKPDSPPDDLVSFSLKKGMIRAWNFETIDSDDTFEFQYCGEEEGQMYLDRDRARKQRDDDEARARLEEEQKRIDEARRREEERQQAEEEQRKQEEDSKRQEEEDMKRQEEEGKREAEQKLEEARLYAARVEEQKRQEEEQHRLKEEEKKRQEEAERQAEEARRQAEEQRLQEAEAKRQEEARKAEEEKQRQEEERQRIALMPKTPVEVAVFIDRSLDLKISASLMTGDSMEAVKRRLVEEDPTGQTKLEEIRLKDPSSGRMIDDSELITGPLELDLVVG